MIVVSFITPLNVELHSILSCGVGEDGTNSFVHTTLRSFTLNIVEATGEVGNPPQGTLVDKDIGIHGYNDFYLVSSKSIYTTVKPVHYIIIHDDQKIPIPQLQSLTFAMCHCYPNWPGPFPYLVIDLYVDAIRVPFPTQLAHKLAHQLGESNVDEPEINPELQSTYFYL